MSYIEKIEDSSIVRIRHDIRDAFSILNADPYQDSTKKELEAAIHNKL